VLNDGRTENRWDCDPGMLRWGRCITSSPSSMAVPRSSASSSTVLNDGGEARQFGWGRYSPHLRGVGGSEVRESDEQERGAEATRTDTLQIGPGLDGEILALRIYARPLLTSEAIGNYRAGA
jgi:hypothetical protein